MMATTDTTQDIQVMQIVDPELQRWIRAEREATGADRVDEVWEGVYVVNPLPNNQHQELVGGIGTVLTIAIDWQGLGTVYPGVNVSDREADWNRNYRIPDVAVYLKEGQGKDCETHYFGGPDFLAEVLSPYDRSREKLSFYAKTGVREALFIDRDPWALELYRHDGEQLVIGGRSVESAPVWLMSDVIPLRFRLLAGEHRPVLEIQSLDGEQHWTI